MLTTLCSSCAAELYAAAWTTSLLSNLFVINCISFAEGLNVPNQSCTLRLNQLLNIITPRTCSPTRHIVDIYIPEITAIYIVFYNSLNRKR